MPKDSLCDKATAKRVIRKDAANAAPRVHALVKHHERKIFRGNGADCVVESRTVKRENDCSCRARVRKRGDFVDKRVHVSRRVAKLDIDTDLRRLAPHGTRGPYRRIPEQVAGDEPPASRDGVLLADKEPYSGASLHQSLRDKRVDGLAHRHARYTAFSRQCDFGAKGLAGLHCGDTLTEHIRDARVERRPPSGFLLLRHDESRLAQICLARQSEIIHV